MREKEHQKDLCISILEFKLILAENDFLCFLYLCISILEFKFKRC